MIISNLVGGIGNQMFQYACARALSLDLNLKLKFCTDFFGSKRDHNGFELDKVFNLNLEIAKPFDLMNLIGWTRSHPIVRRILAKNKFSWIAGSNFINEPHFNYYSDLKFRAQQGAYLQGYWQSEKYFARHKSCIQDDFTFRESLKGLNYNLARTILQNPSISIHVRRGDYINNPKSLAVHGTCSPEYYFSAIEMLLQKCRGAKLIAFSDDPRWVADALKPRYPDLVLVDHNIGLESYIDMRLMSLCRHHIIANSSFSWWGAWLNPSPDKIVVAPARWFADWRGTPDLIPEGWECI